MIKYIGSKRALLPWIINTVRAVNDTSPISRVCDLFAGTNRVGHALKQEGYHVLANDSATYSYVLAQALIEADRSTYPPHAVLPLLTSLMRTEPMRGFVTRNYCEKARFFQPKNGKRIDAIRAAIEERSAGDPLLRAVLLTSLMLAADKVDSTTGIQMAYLKQWAKRSNRDLALGYPPLLQGGGKAVQQDAIELAGTLDVDLVYVDPPYNQHKYVSNYHIWETLVLNDAPEVYGKARKRTDCRTRKSPFNSKPNALPAMRELVRALDGVPHALISFSDEGFIEREEMMGLLQRRPYTLCLAREHRRYVGALIGVHNPEGERVGSVSHTHNREFLFLSTYNAEVHEAVREAAQRETAGEQLMML